MAAAPLSCPLQKRKGHASAAAAIQAMPPPVAALLPRPKNPTRQHGLALCWLLLSCPKVIYRVVIKVGFLRAGRTGLCAL